MNQNTERPIISDNALGFTWATEDPFLFCVHHHDVYPAGNSTLGLDKEHLTGRPIGQDFQQRDGFRMYHGSSVPGFPVHPHCGFETITIVRKGFIDHSDSLGAAARFGEGDVQWMTAGKGIQHSEMFPLLNSEDNNELELFQIWMNLPAKSKMATPHFEMYWAEKISKQEESKETEFGTHIDVIAGSWKGTTALLPPPNSWAADPSNEVAIYHLVIDSQGQTQLPQASSSCRRQLFIYEGEELEINGKAIKAGRSVQVRPEVLTKLKNRSSKEVKVLILQGKPISEAVVQHGPFVGNEQKDIINAFERFQSGEFGQWDWPNNEPVHSSDAGRFAKYPDGKFIQASEA
jgi:redox-sensitive bicupin YhaK (pirin superfamily)